jgi:transcriptional regulator with XRE-family HTH domain
VAKLCHMLTGTRQRRQRHTALIGLRLNEGLSREALAYRAGISRETVRLAESGFVPTPRVQFALAGVFGKRPLDLWPIETQQVFR